MEATQPRILGLVWIGGDARGNRSPQISHPTRQLHATPTQSTCKKGWTLLERPTGADVVSQAREPQVLYIVRVLQVQEELLDSLNRASSSRPAPSACLCQLEAPPMTLTRSPVVS